MKKKLLDSLLTQNQIGIFYIGQVGFIIKYHGKYIGQLVEPVRVSAERDEGFHLFAVQHIGVGKIQFVQLLFRVG